MIRLFILHRTWQFFRECHAIANIQDIPKLKWLFKQAIAIGSLAEFQTLLDENENEIN